MSKRILSFEQYVQEADRSEEIEKDIVDLGEPEDLEDEKEEEVPVAEEEHSEEESEEESEEVVKTVSEMLKEVYEAAYNEACAYEKDDYTEHTVESYLNEVAAMNAGMMFEVYEKSHGSVKESDITLEMYEAIGEGMKEAYSKKIDEMKESFTSGEGTTENIPM